MNLVTLVVIIVAFVIGYKLISWLMDRLNLSQTAADTDEPERHSAVTGSSRLAGSIPREPYAPPESRYARVLNLPRVYTASEITANYRLLIAKYAPDKVHRLGPELQETARRKTAEIVEAYEYFRVKYNLR